MLSEPFGQFQAIHIWLKIPKIFMKEGGQDGLPEVLPEGEG